MQSVRVSLLMCAVAMAVMLGCDEGAEPGARNESTATACTIVRATAPWWNQSFPEQTGRFTATFEVTPSATDVDAVIGLSDGAATAWTKLAAIVRFNPQGLVDVRSGSTYSASHAYHYAAGTTYHVRFDVDVARRRYSVWISSHPDDVPFARTRLAAEVPFRTEQASVMKLNNVASYINPQTSPSTSSVELCSFSAFKDDRTGDNCLASSAGAGFKNTPITVSSGGLTVAFAATPSAVAMDGVIGVANGEVDAYNDFAASVRFWTNGLIEARDGDVYRSDVAMMYEAGREYVVRLIMDVPTKTYSVFVHGYGPAVQVARGYRFRTQQQAVPQLDELSTVVASSFGALTICKISEEATFSLRQGSYEVLPLADDARLISDGIRTTLVDAAGKDVAVADVGGKLAVDAAGNLYVARVVAPQVVVDRYSPTLDLRWRRQFGDGFYGTIADFQIAANGDLMVAAAANGDAWNPPRPYHVLRVSPDGLTRSSIWLPEYASAAVVSDDGYLLAYHGLQMYAWDETLLWQRSFGGSHTISHLARDADGAVAFGGELHDTSDFGTGPLETYWSPEGDPRNAFVALLSPNHTTRFASKLEASYVRGIAMNGQRVAVSADERTQLQYPHVYLLDLDGLIVRHWAGFLRTDLGAAGRVALSASNVVFANVAPIFLWGPEREAWPYLFTLAP